MGTLLMRLAGPLQSWGVDGRFTERTTLPHPSKSGVVGLLAAALGRRREDDISDIANLKVAVRIDQPGRPCRDFQTACKRKYDRALGQWLPDGTPYVSRRRYLSDAVFVVAIEMPDDMLEEYATALDHPSFPLFLGRRACPPAGRILIGTYPGKDMMTALGGCPWQASERLHRIGTFRERELPNGRIKLDVVRDTIPSDSHEEHVTDTIHDMPVSFSSQRRMFAWRTVVWDTVAVANPYAQDAFEVAIDEHNPMEAAKAAVGNETRE